MVRVPSLYLKFALGFGVFFALFEILYLRTGQFPYDGLHYVIGWDFVNSWMGGKAALAGNPAIYFDHDHYNVLLRQAFAADLPDHNWSYPPHVLLLLWPFGLFPYLASYALWIAVGLGLFLWTASEGKLDRSLLVFIALSPIALVLVLTGQNGFFTGALLLAVLWQWDKRPALAGVMLGLLTVKPQLVLLMPLVLVMTRRWRCLGFAALTAAAMAGLTTLIYGTHVWQDYLVHAVPFQNLVLTQGKGLMLGMMPTAFTNARLMGAPLSVAWALQAVVSVIALGTTIWTFFKRRDPLLSAALLLTASLLVTPYAFNYDMAALIAVLARLGMRPVSERVDMALILAVWLLPVVMMLGFFVKIAGSTLVLLALLNRLVERLRKTDSTSAFTSLSSPANISA